MAKPTYTPKQVNKILKLTVAAHEYQVDNPYSQVAVAAEVSDTKSLLLLKYARTVSGIWYETKYELLIKKLMASRKPIRKLINEIIAICDQDCYEQSEQSILKKKE